MARKCSRCGPESLEQPSLRTSQAPRTSASELNSYFRGNPCLPWASIFLSRLICFSSRRQWSVVSGQWSVVSGLLCSRPPARPFGQPTVGYLAPLGSAFQLSAFQFFSFQFSVFSFQFSAFSFQLSVFSFQFSAFSFQFSPPHLLPAS